MLLQAPPSETGTIRAVLHEARVCMTSVTYVVHPSGSCTGSVRGGAGFGLHTLCDLQRYFMKCPRRESNPHHRFRKPAFYPLNYGDFFLSAIYGVFDMPATAN